MGVWVGFDEKVTLGDKETGGRVALPIWFEAMQRIYKDRKGRKLPTAAGPGLAN
jgi:penicillin-binding protein 1A